MLADTHPEMARRWLWITDMYKMLYPKDPLPKLSQTFRNAADQNRMKSEGGSALVWPHSTHNNVDAAGKPASLAVDFFFDVGGKTAYPQPWLERVTNLAYLAGLFSGSVWRLRDWPHLALVQYRSEWPSPLLTPLPELPVAPQGSSSQPPVLRYYPDGGPQQVHRGRGDILIRISRNANRLDPVAVDVRYDEPDDGK